jgi:cytochrome c oxidase subunit 2
MRPGLLGVVASGLLALGLLTATAIVLAPGPASSPVPVAVAPPTLTPPPTLAPTATPVPIPATAVPVASAVDGATLFQRKGCIGCHSISAVALKSNMGFAPELSALAQVAPTRRPGMSAEAYVRESVREPQAFRVAGFTDLVMPILPVTDAELDTLVTFLLTKR